MSTVMPPNNSQIEAASTKRAAWVAAVAAIVAAVLSLAGSIGNVYLSDRGETARSRAEFVRGERREVYTKVA